MLIETTRGLFFQAEGRSREKTGEGIIIMMMIALSC